MLYPLVIDKVEDGYAVLVPDIDGCYSAGNTLDEAISNAKQAICFHVEGLIEDGEEIPKPSALESHVSNVEYQGKIFAVVDVDLNHLMGQSEKINITLPKNLIRKIDSFVATHPEYKNRSNFIAQVSAKVIFT